MDRELSMIRLLLMRALYVLIAFLLGYDAWTVIVSQGAGWTSPVQGVAYAFWGALSLLALIGIRFPVRMLPILLIQFLYKGIWLAAVAYPLWSAGKLDPTKSGLFFSCAVGIVLDLIVIPWPYVFRHYIAGVFSRQGI